MRYFQILKVAYKALGRNKMRSSLTMLGIIIGVAAVIAMLGIGEGAKKMVNAQIASLGDNLFNIFPGSFISGGLRAGPHRGDHKNQKTAFQGYRGFISKRTEPLWP